MNRRMYVMVATWIAPPDHNGNHVWVRECYGVCDSEAHARGLAMVWLDKHYPQYKAGSKFALTCTVVNETDSRALASSVLGVDLDALTVVQKFALRVLQTDDLIGARALIDKLTEDGVIVRDSPIPSSLT